jgi:hypothetical protein
VKYLEVFAQPSYIRSHNRTHKDSRMRLTNNIQELLLNKDAKGIRTRLALALDFSERWILKCAQDNKDNGPLTTIAALKVLRKETGFSQSEILEEAIRA